MYAQLVNNLDELGFTDVEPYLSEYLTKVSKEGISVLDAFLTERFCYEIIGLRRYK